MYGLHVRHTDWINPPAVTKALDLSFDGASIFGGDRSKRYALVIEDGAVKEAHVESDNTGLNGSFLLFSPCGMIIGPFADQT